MLNLNFSQQVIHELFFKKKYKNIEPQISRKEAIAKFISLINKRLNSGEECAKLLKGKLKVNPKLEGTDAYNKFINGKDKYDHFDITVCRIDMSQFKGKTYKGKYIDPADDDWIGDAEEIVYDLIVPAEEELIKYGYSLEYDGDAVDCILFVILEVGARIKIGD